MSLNTFIKKALPFYFIYIFANTVVAAFIFYLTKDVWSFEGWLSNYQGGFVRRGFLGEVIFQIAALTHTNPGLYVSFLQIFLYAVYLYFSYRLLQKRTDLIPYSLLIFSPFLFNFQVVEICSGCRKEIIAIALLSFLVWFKVNNPLGKFEKLFRNVFLIFPAIILTHEMTIVFIPYFLILYVSAVRLAPRKIARLCILLIPSICAFMLTMKFKHLTRHQAIQIFQSLESLNFPLRLQFGAIGCLTRTTEWGRWMVREFIKKGYYIEFYGQIILASSVAFFPVRKSLHKIFCNKLEKILALSALMMTIVLCYVAYDWGRFIYIHLVSFFLLSLAYPESLEIASPKKAIATSPSLWQRVSKLRYVLFGMLLFVYSSYWYIPHCCPKRRIIFKTENNFVKPAQNFKKLITIINRQKKSR